MILFIKYIYYCMKFKNMKHFGHKLGHKFKITPQGGATFDDTRNSFEIYDCEVCKMWALVYNDGKIETWDGDTLLTCDEMQIKKLLE